jgi:hypothetical protein
MKIVSLLFALGTLAACASAPPAAPPAAPAATASAAAPAAAPAPATAAAPAAAATPAAAAEPGSAAAPLNGNMVRSAVAPSSEADKELARWARTEGFRLTKIKQKVMWCKNDAEIGSHLARTNCVSDDTLVEMRKVYEANKSDLLNLTRGCSSGMSGMGGGCGSK